MSKLIVISGPSAGAGKDTLIKMFLEKHAEWVMPVSTTTREPRAGEIAGVDMDFVSHEQFMAWQKENKFLEAIEVDNGKWYGTLHEPVEKMLESGRNVMLRKDVRGAQIIKEKLPKAVTIFVAAESEDALEQRIRKRGTEDEESIQRRLRLAKEEVKAQDKFDHTLVNYTGKTEKALADLEKIVLTST